MTCALCLYLWPPEEQQLAITVIGGYAMCERHVPIVAATLGGDWRSILAIGGLPAEDLMRARPQLAGGRS